MRNIGLIIVFDSFENMDLKDYFVANLKKIKDVRVCIVCTNTNDDIFEDLTEIAELCSNTSFVNIKRNKSNISSVRAGARYLSNKYNLKYLGFIAGLNDFEILEVIKEYIQNQETIVTLNKIENENKAFKPTFFQSLFSVTDYLAKIA